MAYFVSALFVNGLVNNHKRAIRHFSQLHNEQRLRREAEEQLRVLAESSPAAILTVDGEGAVLAANGAAYRLLMIPEEKVLDGRSIADYFPLLADALRFDSATVGLSTSVKCQGRRENGEMFLAHMWFSSYLVPDGKRLAAIIVDSSEEMREREEQELHQLLTGNQIATAVIAHEVRNVCSAMTMLCDDLRHQPGLAGNRTLSGLDSLVAGLEAIASFELQYRAHEVRSVSLQEILDNLRIVVEPAWREIAGTVHWNLPARIPSVWAEPHGLMQALLNLSQNSLRAVQEGTLRQLDISVVPQAAKVLVSVQDSGPGVHAPEGLFRPFQQGASGSGLGLYVSRFLVRSYGGELRFERPAQGSRFVIELDVVQGESVSDQTRESNQSITLPDDHDMFRRSVL